MSENIEGALVFKSTLDNSEFNNNIGALEERLRSASHLAIIEGDKIDSVFKKIGAGILSYFSVSNLQAFTAHLIKVRSEFQNLEASFKVFLGSGTRAKEFMKELQEYAINNVFEFKDLARVSSQLLVYGNDISTVIPILEKLSNIASGTNQPLEDLANLYNKAKSVGKLMTIDLQQWQRVGVPIVQEMAKSLNSTQEAIWEMASSGSISFRQLDTILTKLTSSGGMFFGMMKEKMGNLGDTVGQLSDSLTVMFNEIGAYSQDYLKAGLLGVNTLVENYKEIGKVLASLTIAYGSYRAAIVLNTLATKGHTGIALIDSTIRQGKLALLKAEAIATGQTAAIQSKMTAAQLANTAALETKLTVQERQIVLNKLETNSLMGLLSSQQQQYLSNLNLTAGSKEYNQAAMEVLSVEQQQRLKKEQQTKGNVKYIEILRQEVLAKEKSRAASLESMRSDVKAAAAKLNEAKLRAINSIQALEAAKAEVAVSKQVGDATRLQRAEKTLLAATENASITRKGALAAQTDFLSKKKLLETAASRQSAAASTIDTASKTTQSAATSLLTTATNKASLALKTLWTSMKANPIGWLVSILGLAVSAFTMFSKKKEEEININKQINDQIDEEIGHVGALVKALNGAKDSIYLRKQVIEKLNPILSKYNLELLNESDAISKITSKYHDLTDAIGSSLSQRYKSEAFQKIAKEQAKEVSAIFDTFLQDVSGKNEGLLSKIGKRAVVGANKVQGPPQWAKKLEEDKALFETFTNIITNTYEKLQKENASLEDIQTNLIKTTQRLLKTTLGASEEEIKSSQERISRLIADLTESKDKGKKAYNEVKENAAKFEKITEINEDPKTKYSKMSLDTLDTELNDLNKKLKEYNLKSKEEKAQIDNKVAEINKLKLSPTYDPEALKQLNKDLAEARKNSSKTQEHIKETKSDIKLAQNTIKIKENALNTDKSLDKRIQQLIEARGNVDNKSVEYTAIDNRIKVLQELRKKPSKEQSVSSMQGSKQDFNAELDYKKQQYELYYKWVEHVGEASAKDQFEALLKDGSSYEQYIQNSIAALEQKKASGSITDEELNNLIKLTEINKNLNGKINPLEAFTSSLQEGLSAAGGLAEELEVVVQKKKELANGKTGIINKDEQKRAGRMLDAKEHEIQQRLQQKLLADFKSYEDKKLSIQKEYQALREQAQKQNNAELLAEVNKGEQEALSTLNASYLMQTDSWKNLFSDLDSLSVEAIDKLIKEIEAKMADANLELKPADKKAVLDRLNEARAKLVEKSPFAALGYALEEVFNHASNESAKTAAQVQSDWANLAAAAKGSFNFLSGLIADSKVIKDLLGDSADDVLKGLQHSEKAVEGAVSVAASVASGNIFGVISGGLKLVTGVADFVDNIFVSKDKKKDKQIENMRKGVQNLQHDYDRLGKAIDSTYSEDVFSKMDEQDDNLRQQQDALRTMIALEQSKKRSDQGKIDEFNKQIQAIDDKLEDSQRKRREMLAGTDIKSAIDQFGDALVQAYVKGENAAEKLGEVTKKVMQKAVTDAIKRQFLARGIEEAMNYLSDAMSDGGLSEYERQQFQEKVQAAGEKTNAALEAVGDWIKDPQAKEAALEGAIKGVSEETASVLAGRINQVVLYQSDGLQLMRQSLLYHAEVAANTRNISITNETLKRIEDKLNTNTLLSQGIS